MASSAADCAPSSTDTNGDVVIKTGEVTSKGRAHKLMLSEKGLRLISTVQDKSGSSVAPVKKSKSTAGAEAETQPNKIFAVHFIKSSPKSNKRRCANIQLEVTDGSGSDVWISQIEEKRKEGKPQKLLVVINPIGGKGTAQQTYAKQVQPLFALAGIETVVKVTERAKHALDIGKTFDTSTVDGVVIVGGDGLYAELLHALVLRAQEAAGVDVNDPDAQLAPLNIRIGIVPAGTGNGVSQWLNGNVTDVETATLNIIRGETNPTGIFSVHEPDTMLASVFGKKPVLSAEIEVLRKSPQPPSEKAGEGDTADAAVSGFLAKITEGENDRLYFNPFGDSFDLFLLGEAGGFSNLKFIFGLLSRKKSAMDAEFVEGYRNIVGYRLRILEEEVKDEAAASNSNMDHHDYSRMLDIDGELLTCSVPHIDVRLHAGFIQAFSVNSVKD
ncbi:hypothetical protein BaRGS_00007554 [Batillaria attramentaria]|uniref:DAGKc domain-containing protein n=1 Tax=Batillaria attramentaria TaxID=370345 RepID=A0ABD0LPY7_9CAEN